MATENTNQRAIPFGKESYPKAALEAMSDEQKKNIPIIGNVKTWDDFAGGESAPVAAAELQGGSIPDDLPF